MKLPEVTDNRPLIWRLVAQQLGKDKRVLFYARLPWSSSRLIGNVISVFDDYAAVKRPGVPALIKVSFSEDDDKRLTLRPSNDPTVADFTVADTV